MFDLLGWGEIILILLLALVIVGPKDLPKVLYTVGRWVHKLKKTVGHFQRELEGLARIEQLKRFEQEFSEPTKKVLPKTSQGKPEEINKKRVT